MTISRMPQNIDEASWYYENKGSIEVIIHTRDAKNTNSVGRKRGTFRSIADSGFIHLRIPSKMLLATLKRQGRAR